MWLDRWLGVVSGGDPAARAGKLRAFELILLMQIVAERWRHALVTRNDFEGLLAVVALGLAAPALVPRLRRLALLGLIAMQAALIASEFPATANHYYLVLYMLLIGVWLDPRREHEAELMLLSLRWLVVCVFFWAGLQKLLYGFYFRGEFLAFYLSRESFQVLGPLLSEAEKLRLMPPVGPARGPFHFDSPLLLLLSNAAWIAELGTAGAMLVPRLHRFAVASGALFLIATEALVREFFFGALFMNGILLFAPGDLNRRLLPVFALFFVWLIGMTLGVLPGIYFY